LRIGSNSDRREFTKSRLSALVTLAASTKPGERKGFRPQEFRFAVSLFDKITDPHWEQASHAGFLWVSTTEFAALLRPVYIRAQATNASRLREPIFLDDNSHRKLLATAKKQFRSLKSNIPGRSSRIGTVAFRGSEANEMIQLIDMICGSVRSR
jgi:hypothetical protein